MSLSVNTIKSLGNVTLKNVAPIALRTGLKTSLNLNRLYTTGNENPTDKNTEIPVENTQSKEPEQPKVEKETNNQQQQQQQEQQQEPKEKSGIRLPLTVGVASALAGYYFYEDYKRKPKIVKTPNNENDIEKFIGKDEATLFVKGKKFSRVDVNSVAHNEPTEDSVMAAEIENGFLFGVCDGHGGSQCSKNVSKFLPEYFKEALKIETEEANKLWFWQKPCRKQIIEKAFKKAFLALDEDLVNLAFNTISNIKKPESLKLSEQQKVLDIIPSSITGCSVTVAFIENDDVYVASTGCSQSFISKEHKNNWEVRNISDKHDLKNNKEKTLLTASHPKEDVIIDNKVLGIYKETRSFGDSLLKWTNEQRSQIEKYLSVMDKRYLENIDKKIVSPPYMTAEPEVKALKIKSNDRFMVISSEELSKHMDQQKIASTIAEYKQQNGKDNSATVVMKKAFNADVNEDMSLLVIFFNGNEEGKSTLKYN